MVATLRTVTHEGHSEILSKCTGKGEIHWPYIRLEPTPTAVHKTRSMSHGNVVSNNYVSSTIINDRIRLNNSNLTICMNG